MNLVALSRNNFSAFQCSLEINLSHNHLSGSLPQEIGNLRIIGVLDMSENMLSGEISSSLSGCTSLEILHLGGNMLEGGIPSSFSSLIGIRELNLSFNNLTGRIPLYMQKMSLQHLDISFNKLEGEVPSRGIFANASATFVEGNKRLCGFYLNCKSNNCIILPAFLEKKKKQAANFWVRLERALKKISYQSLLKVTYGFSPASLLGIGSFGSIYRGVLEEDGTNVAVNVLDLDHQGASKSFVAECDALRNIRHLYLVKIVTACSSIDFQGNDFKALVYELMPNGSLEWWLHSSVQIADEISRGSIEKLSLLQRIGIAIDVASALDYLHHYYEESIVHCDLKPINVLLDNDMSAHLGDFRLARVISEVRVSNQSSSVGVRGAIGYAAPEYGMGSEISIHGDLYNYRILLLEMMTGKRPTNNFFEGGCNLHNYANMALPDQIEEILDPNLLQEVEALIVVNRRRGQNINMMDYLVSIIRIGGHVTWNHLKIAWSQVMFSRNYMLLRTIFFVGSQTTRVVA